jgi:nicotinate-nucleotide adenylyltransferase
MRVGFFGGTFDPPHRGHLAVARAAAKSFGLSRVLLAPVAVQPLKSITAEASFDDRLQMVQLLCENASELEPSTVDGPRRNGEPNYTIDTLHRLRHTLPETAELFAIVGADAFIALRQWRAPDELLQAAQWIVVSRPYSDLPSWDGLKLSPEQRARVYPLEGIAEPASASSIRTRLHAGQDCSEFLPASIFNYIHAHHLYGA